MTEPIRVLIVDDHPVVRHGLRSMLSSYSDFEISGEAGDGATALQEIARLRPDIVLLDVRLPGQDGIQVARQIKRSVPDIRVIMLTIFDDMDRLTQSLEAGVDGYLLKRASPAEMAGAIRAVYHGQRTVSKELMTTLLGGYATFARQQTQNTFGLSDDELQILDGMANGASYKRLADQLGWSEVTIRRKVQDIYQKLNVSDRAEAVATAIRNGLI